MREAGDETEVPDVQRTVLEERRDPQTVRRRKGAHRPDDAAVGSLGGLVIELAEMKTTKGMDNDYLKGFISRASDHMRLPYDRCASENVRRFVIIGTTNEAEFLSDPTGNRRYFPFTANPEKAIVGFGEGGFRSNEAKEYIIQVWAEAYQRYMPKEGWDLNPKTIQMAKIAQEASTINNPNVDILSELVDELYPLPGARLCRKDLEFILSSNAGIWGDEAIKAADLWMMRRSRSSWPRSRN
ncbi:VapE domain-containing protein [Methanomethylophilus alvi]|uniref:VapE domain-containing protein n=1 Tax=Methanomethylophilus alvi TaxID=1291540 RepID=UPI0037DDCC98